MTLPASGALTFGQINTELGDISTSTRSLNDAVSRALARVPSGLIAVSNFYGKSSGFKQGIFGFGSGNFSPSFMSTITNIVSSAGVVASDVSGVGNIKRALQAATFGGDKGIFGFGYTYVGSTTTTLSQNIVSNTGVVASDTFATGSSRTDGAGAGYGNDKGLYAFGNNFATGRVNTRNLITNTGVVASDTAGAGTAREALAAATYGYDKAIFGFGFATSPSGRTAVTNLVSNTGVIATDTAGVGTVRTTNMGAATFGIDRAIFGFGYTTGYTAITNLVSNTGVVATDTAGVGTVGDSSACGYGGTKAIFGFKYNGSFSTTTNLVSSTGVVTSDTTSAGTARYPAATSWGQ